MNKAEIHTAIRPIISQQLGVELLQIDLHQNIADDLGADSLDTAELIMAIEDHFNIEIPDEDAEKLATVRMLVDYIHANHNPLTIKVTSTAVELAKGMINMAVADTLPEPLNLNSVWIYIDNTITQKRGIAADKSNSIFAREEAKHQIEVLQVMREELFGADRTDG